MTLNFDSTELVITCPNCKHKFKERIGRLKNNPTLPCAACRSEIVINADEIRKSIKSAEKSLADFKRSAGRMFK